MKTGYYQLVETGILLVYSYSLNCMTSPAFYCHGSKMYASRADSAYEDDCSLIPEWASYLREHPLLIASIYDFRSEAPCG